MESVSPGLLYNRFFLLIFWLIRFQDVLSHKSSYQSNDKFILADPPIGLIDPIDISPTVIPHNTSPLEPLSPMYPNFPSSYDPVLSGRCPMNLSSISNILDKTASDCSVPLAPLVGNVICCPQANSLMNIFQAVYSESNELVLNQAAANDCFSDVMSILASRGANSNISELCSLKPSNLTDSSCPVKDVASFEKIANTSKLLDACSSVDPLKECCRPICQPAIVETALHISSGGASSLGGSRIPGMTTSIDVLSDCKGVVYSWLSRKLSPEDANAAFRVLSGCKVNKVCPLEFEEPTAVIEACRNMLPGSSSCCAALHTYIATRQKQIFVTNIQAINCATMFGSMLQKAGVKADVYGLCQIDLKDFSNQAFGQQGCLLRSLPTDIVFDNVTGISFICDLSDNIAAPWPSSSSMQSLSLCAPEMSLPALPVLQTSGTRGNMVPHSGSSLPLLFLTAAATMVLLRI